MMVNDNLANKEVAYFDFDGTITSRDTFIPFLIFTIGYFKFFILLPLSLCILILYIMKVIDNEKAKELMLQLTITNMSSDFIEKKAKNFANTHIDKYIKPEIFERVKYHYENGHIVIIASANLEVYLKYFIKRHDLHGVIATQIAFKNNRATGKLLSKNCYGAEKINRVNEYLNKNKLNFIYSYAYGNSRGDFELLNYANEGFWVEGITIIPWKEKSEYFI